MAILNLPPVKWEFKQEKTRQSKMGKLGDGYSLSGYIPFSDRTNYNVVFPGLTNAEFNSLFNLFKFYAGSQTFEWRPLETMEYKTYAAENISSVNQGEDCWQMSVTFTEIK